MAKKKTDIYEIHENWRKKTYDLTEKIEEEDLGLAHFNCNFDSEYQNGEVKIRFSMFDPWFAYTKESECPTAVIDQFMAIIKKWNAKNPQFPIDYDVDHVKYSNWDSHREDDIEAYVDLFPAHYTVHLPKPRIITTTELVDLARPFITAYDKLGEKLDRIMQHSYEIAKSNLETETADTPEDDDQSLQVLFAGIAVGNFVDEDEEWDRLQPILTAIQQKYPKKLHTLVHQLEDE